MSVYRRSCWGQKCRHIRRVYKYDPRCNPIPSPPAKERLKKAWFVVGAIPGNEFHQSPETRSAPGREGVPERGVGSDKVHGIFARTERRMN